MYPSLPSPNPAQPGGILATKPNATSMEGAMGLSESTTGNLGGLGEYRAGARSHMESGGNGWVRAVALVSWAVVEG